MPGELTKRIQANSNFNKFAEAGNGKIVVNHGQESKGPTTNESLSHTYSADINPDFKIREFKSWADYPDRPGGEWDIGKLKQVVAGRTTFTALSAEGDVWTWGDIRYQACLGRDLGGNESNSRYSTFREASRYCYFHKA
jgi:hypothetical protein